MATHQQIAKVSSKKFKLKISWRPVCDIFKLNECDLAIINKKNILSKKKLLEEEICGGW